MFIYTYIYKIINNIKKNYVYIFFFAAGLINNILINELTFLCINFISIYQSNNYLKPQIYFIYISIYVYIVSKTTIVLSRSSVSHFISFSHSR